MIHTGLGGTSTVDLEQHKDVLLGMWWLLKKPCGERKGAVYPPKPCLLIDEAGDTLHTTSASQTTDGWFGDPLDVVGRSVSNFQK